MTAPHAGLDNSELLVHCVGRHGLRDELKHGKSVNFTKDYEFMRLRQTHVQVHQTYTTDHVHRPDGSVIESEG